MKRLVSYLLVPILCSVIIAQGPQVKQTAVVKDTPKTPATAQPINAEYTKSIIDNTTDKQFLTELVDHLPLSATVPSPDKIIGYPVGTPNKLTYTKDQHRYYRELEKATQRVKTFVAPEKSEQGREQLTVVVGDEATLAKLDRYKEILGKLADPRTINDEIAKQLIAEGKAVYWACLLYTSPSPRD